MCLPTCTHWRHLANATELVPMPIPPQNCSFPWGIWIPDLLYGSLGPPESSIPVLNPNDISVGSAVFVGLTNVTEGQTDRQTTLLGR